MRRRESYLRSRATLVSSLRPWLTASMVRSRASVVAAYRVGPKNRQIPNLDKSPQNLEWSSSLAPPAPRNFLSSQRPGGLKWTPGKAGIYPDLSFSHNRSMSMLGKRPVAHKNDLGSSPAVIKR
jgi:hypothetical protein